MTDRKTIRLTRHLGRQSAELYSRHRRGRSRALPLSRRAMPLTDPDEGRYALIARQMATSGDWLVPRLFGLPYLEKPPLLYWLTATMFRIFGTGELSARLAPGLAAAFGVAATGWFARTFSPTAGVLASATLMLCAIYVVLARTWSRT
jgi:dolichol-phosphate mannosyltransferase